MYANLKGSVVPSRQINEVDILKDNFLFTINKTFCAFPGSEIRNQGQPVIVVRNDNPTKFGLKQPRVKPPGQKSDATKPFSQFDTKEEVKCASFHPFAKNLIAVGLRSGHIQLFDKSLSKPLADLVHSRPLNSIAWSDDGALIFALYIDMTIKVWDVRGNKELHEIKASPTRGVGFLHSLSGRRVLLSYSASGKQELRIYDENLAEKAKRQVAVGGTSLSVTSHFSGVIIACACRESKVYLLDGNTLNDLCIYTHDIAIYNALPLYEKPNPDGTTVMTLSLFLTNNTIARVQFDVANGPARFPPFPVMESDLTPESWLQGTNGTLKHEELIPTPKEEAKPVEEEKPVDLGPQTYYKYLRGVAEPPSTYYISLPVKQAPNPEFNEIITNGTQFAFVGDGSTPPIHILPLYKPQRFPSNCKSTIIDPHSSGVSTMTFSPHKPQLLMSGGEDNKVKLWNIPKSEEFLTPITEPITSFNHNRKISIAKFSECTNNLIMTATPQTEIYLWDINTEKRIRDFNKLCPTGLQDAVMNDFSSMIYSIYRDGKLIWFDPRDESPKVFETLANPNGGRHRRLLYIPDFEYLATFGSSRRGERQILIWDVKNMEKPLKSIELDTSSGHMLPMYEEGSGLIYLGGKGDGHIRYVELCHDDRVIASSGVYETSAPERGLCLLPRKQCDVMKCEVSRMMKLSTESMHIVKWHVLRSHNEYFQDMIYPPIRDTSKPLMEISDWLKKQNEKYPMIDFQPPNTRKYSEVLPMFRRQQQEKLAAAKNVQREEEIVNKPLSIDDIVAMAPKISTSDEPDEVSDDSESW
ncbi:putative coronin [Histomonas meleagridis]|uniref:putative coronin n=1 Tax=Histomonas meleagridis TaxID=135588 RepID=UPI00355A84F2|nr:putative coronin [Histomonas meleagridis]